MMSGSVRPLDLTRAQILAHRRAAGWLLGRLPSGGESLRRAAWAGLQDSVPRAALLSIHARVEDATAPVWEDPSLVQVWGPRYAVYVIAAEDRAVFTLGRRPDDARGRQRAEDMADRLERFLDGRRMTYSEAGHALGLQPNELRYGASTGRILMRWDGARSPVVWTVPPPAEAAAVARLELARRYLHVYGPTTPAAFGAWSSVNPPAARATFAALGDGLLPVRTPIGARWILASDEASFRTERVPAARDHPTVRFLPSGDAYVLAQGPDRELLLADGAQRAALWTPRVWPGALLVGDELAATWRRAEARLTIQAWRRLSPGEHVAVEQEAQSLPLPGRANGIEVIWAD
jgi:Winged helix DNA-binding domain